VGVTDEQIAALAFFQRSPLFDEREQAVIAFAERITRAPATVRDGDLEGLRRWFSAEQIVELVLVIAVANFTNRVNDGLRVEPDLPPPAD
jgi:alkylhydroperoxidase family enzyme